MRVGFRDISRDTDIRSFMGALLPPFPCGHSTPVLYATDGPNNINSEILAFLNSFIFDWQIRQRGGAAHLIWSMLSEMVLPNTEQIVNRVSPLVARLNPWVYPSAFPTVVGLTPSGCRALTVGERARLRPAVDAIAATLYGCSAADVSHVLSDVDLPVSAIGRTNPTLDPCGFWRVGRNKDPELRHTVLTLIAFRDLESKIQAAEGDCEEGIEAFLTQNDGEGWMLPETLRLVDYGLGHDDRAQHPQPVASRLGPRFYDWQLVQSVDESRRECHLHARNLLGMRSYASFLVDLIERGVAEGKDFRDLLTDRFLRSLLDEEGFVAVLADIRARTILK